MYKYVDNKSANRSPCTPDLYACTTGFTNLANTVQNATVAWPSVCKLYTYIYIYICVCVCVYVYVYMCYSLAAPVLWNPLPEDVRSAETFVTFKKSLKTFLFKKYLC